MKQLFDFLPILAFFSTFKAFEDPQQGILYATGVVILGTAVLVGVTRARWRRVEALHLVTLVLGVMLGGVCLLFQDGFVIGWKPALVNGLFGAAFLVTQCVGDRTLVERVMGTSVSLPGAAWRRLNLTWVVFFAVTGVINLSLIERLDAQTWAGFGLFGMLGLTSMVLSAQGVYMLRHAQASGGDTRGDRR